MKAARPYPIVTITPKGERAIVDGHPWVYEGEVVSVSGTPEDGSLVDVVSKKGSWLGCGFYNSASKIRVRLVTRNANDDPAGDAFWERRLRYAWDYRKTVMGEADSRCCRIIFGEADGFPGLTVDRFERVLVAQVLSLGMERIKERVLPLLVRILREDGQVIRGVYERNDAALRTLEGMAQGKGWLVLPGEAVPEGTAEDITENGIRYTVDFENGQKTGFFLDQKYNRLAVAKLAKGRTVLDCFTHTGSFALNAAKGGAKRVTAVDVSQFAVDCAAENARKNGLDGVMDCVCANVFDLLPALERAGTVTLDGALAERIIRRELKVRAYFDRENNLVLCRVAFLYGDTEIDPFAPQAAPVEGDERIMLLRDAAAERRALDLLAAFGFRMQKGRVILGGQEPIYRFLTEGIYRMQENAEVYCSDEFRKMTPRKPHFVGTLRMQDGALRLEMTENGEPAPEVVDILRALRDRKKYFRLKDGSFLDLSEMDEWREMAEAAVGSETGEPEDEEKNARGVMEIATYRAAYMTSLLESGGIPVKVEDSVKNMVGSLQDDGEPCPAPLDQLLRPYQMRGFMWMQALDRLRMGGILADDMGLGKTLQVITLLLWAKRRGDQNAASIVVAPTSLVYNWMAEIAKFAPELRCVAGEGTQAQRAQTIARLSGENRDVDVYLTSYPLIRRDIGLLSKVPFRFAILDEAQYIKNAMSVGAGAVKQLKAQTRLALTGTPMENHPGELWSIFDFVLPGYLNSFAQFMHRFGTGEEANVLRSRIRPFLLRRLKGDVLRELPEKVEITLTADMTEEQRRVYQASLLRLRPQVEGMFSSNNRIEMLAAITELRQICGHPSLVLPSYAASSGKLDLLLDVLPGSLEAGHRALIFSQFTRMLKILQRRLEAVGISCMYLDGETPPKRRIEMVQQFNAGEGQVFLISLKAGGSGLNLVGADTVIHFDPWWNPAAEDQATDRAHRIGQKHKVTVIRMITRGSIEEQVVKLGARKREMFDQMITAGEAMPTQLTPEDIRALFD